jgi:hypothetical protein
MRRGGRWCAVSATTQAVAEHSSHPDYRHRPDHRRHRNSTGSTELPKQLGSRTVTAGSESHRPRSATTTATVPAAHYPAITGAASKDAPGGRRRLGSCDCICSRMWMSRRVIHARLVPWRAEVSRTVDPSHVRFGAAASTPLMPIDSMGLLVVRVLARRPSMEPGDGEHCSRPSRRDSAALG